VQRFCGFLFPALLAPVFILSSCVSLRQEETSSQTLALLGQFQTFQINGAVRSGSRDPFFTIAGLEPRVKFEIEQRLLNRGLRKRETDGELAVYFYFGVRNTSDLFPLPYRISPRSSMYLTDAHEKNRVGDRFTIDLVDARTNELLWSGTDSTYSARQANDFRLLFGAIKNIFKQFPT
jgi:hypothetical protein